MTALARGAYLLETPFYGGPTMKGRQWEAGEYKLGTDGRLRIADVEAQQEWDYALRKARQKSIFSIKMPIITTVGFLTGRLVRELNSYAEVSNNRRIFQSKDFLKSMVRSRHRKIFAILKGIVDNGGTVVAVTPPPRLGPRAVVDALEDAIYDLHLEIGVRVHFTRDWALDETGEFPDRYKRDDGVSATGVYGANALFHIFEMLGTADDDLLAKLNQVNLRPI